MRIFKTANFIKNSGRFVNENALREFGREVDTEEVSANIVSIDGTKEMTLIDYMNSLKVAKTKEPKMEILKKNKKALTEDERKEVMDSGEVWHHGPNGEATPAVWKSEVDGKTWYVCNTHRAYQCKPTLKGAISSYDFIETTSSSKKIIKDKDKDKDKEPFHSLDTHCDGEDDGY